MAVENTGGGGIAEAMQQALVRFLTHHDGPRPVAPVAPLMRPEGLQKVTEQIRGSGKPGSGSGKK